MLRLTTKSFRTWTIPWLAVIASGCVEPAEVFFLPGIDKERFLRVNLRPDVGDLLRDSNFFICPNTVRVGSKARITQYAGREIALLVEGKQYRMIPHSEPVFPRDPAGIDGFLAKYFLDSSEFLQVEALGPPELAQAVLEGTPRVGMTKEQLYACLGPPLKIGGGRTGLSLTRNEILASDQWIYGHQIIVLTPIVTTYYFGDGRLQRIGG